MKLDIKSTLTLRNGVEMPRFGLGVWRVKDEEECVNAIHWAVEAGYPMVDTARAYGNEPFVGKALATLGTPRENVFVTTKLWNEHQGYDMTLRAFDESCKNLGQDVIDLYLIHWPLPHLDKYVESWKAFIRLYEEKRVRAIGVCNFRPHHLERLRNETGFLPMVNQVECHPRSQEEETLRYCRANGIQMEAYSPLLSGNLGMVTEKLQGIADKYGKTPAQVCIRFQMQRDVVVIPKSVHKNRIVENADVFDFELDDSDMQLIYAMNENARFLPDPDVFRGLPKKQ